MSWAFAAKIVPLIVGSFAVGVALISLLNHAFRGHGSRVAAAGAQERVTQSLRLDLAVDDGGIETRVVAIRAITFLAWLLTFLGLVALIGVLPAAFVFVILYMRVEGRERWPLVLPTAAGLALFAWFVFDYLLALPWPQTVLGGWFPPLRAYIPSL